MNSINPHKSQLMKQYVFQDEYKLLSKKSNNNIAKYIISFLPYTDELLDLRNNEACRLYHLPELVEYHDDWFCFYCMKYLFTDMGGDIPYTECGYCLAFYCEDCIKRLGYSGVDTGDDKQWLEKNCEICEGFGWDI